MKTPAKVAIVTLVVGIAGFVTEPNGPLGTFWLPDTSFPKPEGIQLALFMILGAVEALALGLGASFLLFGGSTIKAGAGVSESLASAARLSIAWILMNWWAHDSFHQHIGMNLTGLLGIEYGFHFTLIISGIVLARFFLALSRGPTAAAA